MNITVATGLTPVQAGLTLARKNGDTRRAMQSLTVAAQLTSLQGDYATHCPCFPDAFGHGLRLFGFGTLCLIHIEKRMGSHNG